MSKRTENKGENASLQGGEGQPAFGQDEREFGAGGQTVMDPIDKEDARHRDVNRDPTVPRSREGGRNGATAAKR